MNKNPYFEGSRGDLYVHSYLHKSLRRLSYASRCVSIWTKLFFLVANEKEEILLFAIPSRTLSSLCISAKKHIPYPTRLSAVILGIHWGPCLRITLTLESRMVRKEKELSNITSGHLILWNNMFSWLLETNRILFLPTKGTC